MEGCDAEPQPVPNEKEPGAQKVDYVVYRSARQYFGVCANGVCTFFESGGQENPGGPRWAPHCGHQPSG